MKKLLYIGFSIFTLLFFSSLSNPSENKLQIQSKDTKLPDWSWSSGQVEMKKTASKQSFSLVFDPAIYHPRDSIKITFSTFIVSITNLGNKKSFGQWQAIISLDYFINNNWIPIVEDSTDRLNMPFSNKNNMLEDSIKNYSLFFTVPLTRTLTITASAISYEVDNDSSLPISGKGGPALITSIRGIEIMKLP